MSHKLVRQALEVWAMNMVGAFSEAQTQRENKTFQPTPGTAYWRFHLDRGPVQNPSIGGEHRRYVGWFLITLAFPYELGTGAAETMADAVAARFARGLSSTANQVTTVFDRDPDVKPGRVAGDRWEIPIAVRYYADVQG